MLLIHVSLTTFKQMTIRILNFCYYICVFLHEQDQLHESSLRPLNFKGRVGGSMPHHDKILFLFLTFVTKIWHLINNDMQQMNFVT